MKKRNGIVLGTAAAVVSLCLTAPAGAACPADTDGDGFVGFSDLMCVLKYYGCSEVDSQDFGKWRAADCDRDGCVGSGDIVAVLSQWGWCKEGPDPTPST